MKRILLSLFSAAALLFAGIAPAQVSVDASKTGAAFSTGTWANKPAATAVPSGGLFFASDVGENGAFFQSNATRWRVLNGVASLKTMTTSPAAVAAAETIVLQAAIPSGAWQVGDTIRIRFTLSKSGATDTGSATVRVGTAGTTADTAITGLSARQIFGAASRSGGFEFEVKLVSATSAMNVGSTGATTTSYSGGNASTVSATTAISDTSANALYVSLSVLSGGATDTLTVHTAGIYLVTP